MIRVIGYFFSCLRMFEGHMKFWDVLEDDTIAVEMGKYPKRGARDMRTSKNCPLRSTAPPAMTRIMQVREFARRVRRCKVAHSRRYRPASRRQWRRRRLLVASRASTGFGLVRHRADNRDGSRGQVPRRKFDGNPIFFCAPAQDEPCQRQSLHPNLSPAGPVREGH